MLPLEAMAMPVENVALPAARPTPSSSQKKRTKGKPQLIRKSITIRRKGNRGHEYNNRHSYHGSPDRVMRQLLTYRSELRPLLDAIRFVESSNRDDCPDGDGGASIGPLQISEHYHLDAWHKKRKPSWLRCRELEHAENTVVAYWMRYCSDALSKNDWEVLAKTHNGGPKGPQRHKTAYYWNKVADYLKRQQPPSSRSDEGPSSKPGSSSRCSSFTKLNAGLKVSAGSDRHQPIVNRRRMPRRQALSDISSTFNILGHETESELKKKSRSGLGNLHIHHLDWDWDTIEQDGGNHDNLVNTGNQGSLVDGGNLTDGGNHGSLVVDAGNQGNLVNDGNQTIDSDNQTVDDVYHDANQTIDDGNQTVDDGNHGSPIQGLVEPNREYWKSPESFGPDGNLVMLYSDDVSAQKEEEILTELARLLPPNLCELSGSFEFPQPGLDLECPTPQLKRRHEDVGTTEEVTMVAPVEEEVTVDQEVATEEVTVVTSDERHVASVVEEATVPSPTVSTLADFLLESAQPSTSMDYVRALFSCEDVLLEKLCERVGSGEIEESVSSSKPDPSRKPAATFFCCCKEGHRVSSDSLQQLCALWEEHDVDLLTRSLRFQMFTTPSEEISTPCIAWEIQRLENCESKDVEARKMAKDVLQQQRDMIYVNIGSFSSKQERNRLYSKWGIRKLATGRLKKLVYELLWRDPKRFLESADVVRQYL